MEASRLDTIRISHQLFAGSTPIDGLAAEALHMCSNDRRRTETSIERGIKKCVELVESNSINALETDNMVYIHILEKQIYSYMYNIKVQFDRLKIDTFFTKDGELRFTVVMHYYFGFDMKLYCNRPRLSTEELLDTLPHSVMNKVKQVLKKY